MSQHSSHSNRPPSSDRPYAKRPARSGTQGRPGAKPGHPGHRQALLAPTEVILQSSRSKEAFERLVERWAGIPVSDGYGVYRKWLHGRQTCLAHLIRRARGLAERQEPELAWFGRRVLAELQRLVRWATAPPTSGDVQAWYAQMVRLIRQDHLRRDEAGTCVRTLEREMGALWPFVVEAGVEPTNNRAERALRFAVLWRKMLQGTYNEKGDRWVERILSVRETCRLRDRPTFPVLVHAVTCYFNGQHPDVSWI